jgi:hypothetical protein
MWIKPCAGGGTIAPVHLPRRESTHIDRITVKDPAD